MPILSAPYPIETTIRRDYVRRPPLGAVPDEAHSALLGACAALEAAGAAHWLSYGTLLGFVREGGFLVRDDDIDLAVLAGADPARIAAAMAERGLVQVNEERSRRGVSKQKFSHGPVLVDLFYVFPEGPLWFDEARAGPNSHVRETHPPVAVVRRRFGALELPVPDRAEDYLAHLYGAGWRRPVRRWHWFFSPPNAELQLDRRDLGWLAGHWLYWQLGMRAKALARRLRG